MNILFLLILVFILIIYIAKIVVNRRKRATYLNAGKKWDRIVKELSKRK